MSEWKFPKKTYPSRTRFSSNRYKHSDNLHVFKLIIQKNSSLSYLFLIEVHTVPPKHVSLRRLNQISNSCCSPNLSHLHGY